MHYVVALLEAAHKLIKCKRLQLYGGCKIHRRNTDDLAKHVLNETASSSGRLEPWNFGNYHSVLLAVTDGRWLVLVYCERKLLLSDWWLVADAGLREKYC